MDTKIDNTKDTIINVAKRLFSRFGFHKTSMEEIAKISRKAKGSLYYHFSSKEDLFREVVLNEMNELKKELSVIIEDNSISASDKLKGYFMRRMDIMNKALNYHETLKADFFERFSFIDDLRKDFDEWERHNIGQILLQGVNTGEFVINTEANIISEIIIMILKGLEVHILIQDKYEKFVMHLDNLIKILTKGLSK